MPRARPSWRASCPGWPGRRRELPPARGAPGRRAPGPEIACACLPRRPAAPLLSMPSRPGAVAPETCQRRAGAPRPGLRCSGARSAGAPRPWRSGCPRSGSPRGLNLPPRTRSRERGGARQARGGARRRRAAEAARASGRTPAGSSPTGCPSGSGRQG